MKSLTRKRDDVQPVQQARPSRWRRSRALLITLALLVVLLASAGGYLLFSTRVQPLTLPAIPSQLTVADLGLANWQDYQLPLPANPLNNPELPSTPQIEKSLALLEDAAGQSYIRQGELERGLGYLRAAAQADPENLRINNDYRLALRNLGRYNEEEAFFKQQVQQSKTVNTQIALALAYVDMMRSCPRPPDGLVCQAQHSSRSIMILDDVLKDHPYNIIARYARGLNHLYWPSLMGHLPESQTDLQYVVALLRPLGSISNVFPDHAYTALGDVFGKDGQVDEARNVWLNGKNVVPISELLDSRLNIPQEQLVHQENNQLRGLGVYVETGLAIFWQNRRS